MHQILSWTLQDIRYDQSQVKVVEQRITQDPMARTSTSFFAITSLKPRIVFDGTTRLTRQTVCRSDRARSSAGLGADDLKPY